MATHSSSLAWEIPRTEELGVARVGHNLVTKPPPLRLPFKEGQPKQRCMGGVPDRREEMIRRPRQLKFTRKILRVESCTERGK